MLVVCGSAGTMQVRTIHMLQKKLRYGVLYSISPCRYTEQQVRSKVLEI